MKVLFTLIAEKEVDVSQADIEDYKESMREDPFLFLDDERTKINVSHEELQEEDEQKDL